MGIIGFVEQVKNNEVVLPAIQRDFVWSETKIEKLFDSIMRSYPIGILLLWETYHDIQYRNFVKDYRSDVLFTFYDNKQKKRLKLVLDGQQRLQSLYIAIHGTHEAKHLYFDVLSGHETEDFKEDRYIFRFLNSEQANKLNKEEDRSDNDIDSEENGGRQYFYRISDLITLGPKEKKQFIRDVKKSQNLSDDDEMRMDMNLSILHHVLTTENNILKATIIDEDKPSNSRERKSEADVLEAFVRINREGTPLSRSDLIFSMLKLNWKESATTLPEFVKNINDGNSFELDDDFVIRCLFVVSDLGSKFNIDLLRKKNNVLKIQNNFDRCCNAIRSAVDFLQNECWISSSKLVGGYFNIIPLVYYLFHIKNHQVPQDEIDRVRKAVYVFGFTSPFSRYADSRLGKFIREELKPLEEKDEKVFPLDESLYWVWYWEKITNFGPQFIGGNYSLALHLVQGLSGAKMLYEKNFPQIDHIFPRSELRRKNIDEGLVNHFANFWILSKNQNQNKSNKHPKKYFKGIPDSVLKKALIDRELLDYGRYKKFLRVREAKIVEHIRKKLHISENEFDASVIWEEID